MRSTARLTGFTVLPVWGVTECAPTVWETRTNHDTTARLIGFTVMPVWSVTERAPNVWAARTNHDSTTRLIGLTCDLIPPVLANNERAINSRLSLECAVN